MIFEARFVFLAIAIDICIWIEAQNYNGARTEVLIELYDSLVLTRTVLFASMLLLITFDYDGMCEKFDTDVRASPRAALNHDLIVGDRCLCEVRDVFLQLLDMSDDVLFLDLDLLRNRLIREKVDVAPQTVAIVPIVDPHVAHLCFADLTDESDHVGGLASPTMCSFAAFYTVCRNCAAAA